MERFRYDRSSKWLIEHYGHLILYLGRIRDVAEWRAAQAEVVQPRKLPDGLLEVKRVGETAFHRYIIEIETYADRRAPGDLLDDLMLVYQDKGELPDVLVVVLRPKGQVRVEDGITVRSPAGLSRLQASWRVVELWTVPAADLLATEEPGLVPWVPLCHIDGPPEPVLRECRRILDAKAPAEQHANLLAVTQVLMNLVTSDKALFAIFGGKEAMIESPILNSLIAEKAAEAAVSTAHTIILAILADRFGPVLGDVEERLKAISDQDRLRELSKAAARCADLEAFRQQLA